MAVPLLVAHASAASLGTTVGPTAARDTTGAKKIFVYVVHQSSSPPPAPTDSKGNNYVQFGSGFQYNTTFPGYVFCFETSSASPTVGTGHTWTCTAVATQGSLWVQAVGPSTANGVLAYTTFTAAVTAGAGPYPSPSVTPALTDALLLSFGGTDGVGGTITRTWSNSFTSDGTDAILDTSQFWCGDVGSRNITAAGTYNAQFDDSSTGASNGVCTIISVTEDATPFRDKSTNIFTASNGTVNKPPLLAQNDVQFAWITSDNSGATLGISGGATWAQVGSSLNTTNGDRQTTVLFVQVAGASEPATYAVTNSLGNYTTVTVVAYAGVDTTTPIAAQLATNPDSASPPSSPVAIDASAITTTAPDQKVLFFGSVDFSTAGAATFTDPAGTTRRSALTPADFGNALVCDFTKVSAGSTGTISGSASIAVGNPISWLVALTKTAAGGSPTLTAQPITQTVPDGKQVTLSVVSPEATSYQWYSNASGSFAAISGQTSASYTFTASIASSGRQYYCIATNANGSTQSNTAIVIAVGVPQMRTPYERLPRGGDDVWDQIQAAVVLDNDVFDNVVVSSGLANVWTGAAWTAKPVKYWNGSSWTTKPLKRWNGSAWV